MLTLEFLYQHWNPGYELMTERDKKKARISTRKRIVEACHLTTETATYQWEKNGGVLPVGRAIDISIYDTTITVDVSSYQTTKPGPKRKPQQNQIAA